MISSDQELFSTFQPAFSFLEELKSLCVYFLFLSSRFIFLSIRSRGRSELKF